MIKPTLPSVLKKPLFSTLLVPLLFATVASQSIVRAEPAPKPEEVLATMKKVADWQLANPSKHPVNDWTQAPYLAGLVALYNVSKDQVYLDALLAAGRSVEWKPAPRAYSADDQAVSQAFCELYEMMKDPQMIAPTREKFDYILAHPKDQTLEFGDPNGIISTDRWAWCDALFMAPPAWVRLWSVTGDRRYLEFMDKEWWATTDYLYDSTEGLYFRDSRFFTKKTPNGKKIFWARGNGWVLSGIARVLQYLPQDYPSRPRYVKLFKEMAAAIAKAQQPDGLWRPSLLDPEEVPIGESSGSAFYSYGLAWGVNNGLLDADKYWPVAVKTWTALCSKVQPDGKLGAVQPIGESPDKVTDDSTEVYGTGAFLLAGSEIYKHLKSETAGSNAKPSTWCRFVPERKDDFAWENDRVAFRAYGPAIKGGKEDSAVDCWLKRVPYPIVDKWYAGEQKGTSYHEDHGEGYDPYHCGSSRGCGGLGIWKNGKMITAGPYTEWKIISRTPEKSVFELAYDYDVEGEKIHEVKRITIKLGSQLFQSESTFTTNGKPAALEIAVGITMHDGKAKAVFNRKQGWMSCWETIDETGLGTGVVIRPKAILEMQEIKSQQPDESHALLVTRTDADGKVRFLAGFGWDKAGIITSQEKWEEYLAQAAKALK